MPYINSETWISFKRNNVVFWMRHRKIIPLIIAALLLHLTYSTESLTNEDDRNLYIPHQIKIKAPCSQFKVNLLYLYHNTTFCLIFQLKTKK